MAEKWIQDPFSQAIIPLQMAYMGDASWLFLPLGQCVKHRTPASGTNFVLGRQLQLVRGRYKPLKLNYVNLVC